MTIHSAIRLAQTQLSPASDAPQLDSERLLLHVLNQSETAWLYTHPEQPLTLPQQQRFGQLVARRAAGQPLAHILGEWEFYGRPFYVTPDVLIPRPVTEGLVDAALRYIKLWEQKNNQPPTIADVGTGSGCIAVTLCLETGNQIIATDISLAALAVAKKNAERHGVAAKIAFLQGDMLKPLQNRKVDLIVSNPPYIPSQELNRSRFALRSGATRGKSEAFGLRFEPRFALDGGPDGQRFVNQIKSAGIPALVETTGGQIIRLPLMVQKYSYQDQHR